MKRCSAWPCRSKGSIRFWPYRSWRNRRVLQVLWDSAPGLCLAAAGPCQELELAGSRRFEQAQRFADLCLSRLHDTAADSPAHATAPGAAALPLL